MGTIIISTAAIAVSILSLIVSFVTLEKQYGKRFKIDIGGEVSKFYYINGLQTQVHSFMITIINSSTFPVYVKSVGFWGVNDNQKEFVWISFDSPSDDNLSVKINSQENYDFFISMKKMSELLKSSLIDAKIKNKNLVFGVQDSIGKIHKFNQGNVTKFYSDYFSQFIEGPEYY